MSRRLPSGSLNILWTWLAVAFVLLVSWVVSRLTRWFLTRVATKLTARTETKLDDRLVERLAGPVSALVIVGGFRLSLIFLDLPARPLAFLTATLGVAAVATVGAMVLRAIDVLHEEWLLPWAAAQSPPPSLSVLSFARGAVKVLAAILLPILA